MFLLCGAQAGMMTALFKAATRAAWQGGWPPSAFQTSLMTTSPMTLPLQLAVPSPYRLWEIILGEIEAETTLSQEDIAGLSYSDQRLEWYLRRWEAWAPYRAGLLALDTKLPLHRHWQRGIYKHEWQASFTQLTHPTISQPPNLRPGFCQLPHLKNLWKTGLLARQWWVLLQEHPLAGEEQPTDGQIMAKLHALVAASEGEI
jgi:hypothetical protein